MAERGRFNENNPIENEDQLSQVISSISPMWRVYFRCSICNEIKDKLLKEKGKFTLTCSKCGRKATNTLRYGANTPSKNIEIKNKIKETNIKKYGVSSFLASEEIKQKHKNRSEEENKYIREKIKETNLQRYGTTCPLQAEEVKQKVKNTMIEKYKSSSFFGSEEYLSRRKTLSIEGYKNICSLNNVEWLNPQEWNGLIKETSTGHTVIYYKFRCKKCGNDFEDVFHSGKIPTCRKCNPYSQSNAEKEIVDYINSFYSGYVKSNDRSLFDGKEIDIYLPDLKLGIEYDGAYWHNGSHSDLEKYNLSLEKDINIIFIKEYEWENPIKKNIIKSIIKSKIMLLDNRYYARKCLIKEISSKEYETFCNSNHLQGSAPASVRLGLFNDQELIEVMSFAKSRFDKNYEWEMIRECTKTFCAVIGGKDKLLKYFEKNYSPKSLLSYCDARMFSGRSYSRNGFTLFGLSPENYVYTKRDTDGNFITISRYMAQKHKLKNIVKEFDESLTEKENMIKDGWMIQYDVGNHIYGKRYANL